MSDEIQCYTCVYGMNNYGISCNNTYVREIEMTGEIDKYNCEFYDSISDNYEADINKLYENYD